MLIFKDVLTDDEMISDSYDLKLVDGIVYEADCAMIEEGGVTVGKLASHLIPPPERTSQKTHRL